MKIEIEAGVVVRLDRRTNTSVTGGVYDISTLSKSDRERVLSYEGVSELDGSETSVLDGTVQDVEDYVATATDVAELKSLLAAEKAGNTRKGAVEALEGRIDELESDDETTENTDQE